MQRKWICVEVNCSPERAEELAAEMAMALQVGVEILAEGFRFYLREEQFQDDGKASIEAVLDGFEHGTELERTLRYALSDLLEEDWLEQWKRGFTPLRVGKHLVVAPTWEVVPPRDGDRIIRIDPGQAFGTGHHETTRLCLEWLEMAAATPAKEPSQSLLDVGTGSGILAIAAALLGFLPILALDNDPEAVQVAGQNLAMNGVIDRIRLQVGTVEAVAGRYEVVIANIQALPLVTMAPLLARRLASSGRLVLSGILIEQAAMVQSAYEALGLQRSGQEAAGEWCLLEFKPSNGGHT